MGLVTSPPTLVGRSRTLGRDVFHHVPIFIEEWRIWKSSYGEGAPGSFDLPPIFLLRQRGDGLLLAPFAPGRLEFGGPATERFDTGSVFANT